MQPCSKFVRDDPIFEDAGEAALESESRTLVLREHEAEFRASGSLVDLAEIVLSCSPMHWMLDVPGRTIHHMAKFLLKSNRH